MNSRIDYPERGPLGPDVAVITETSVIEPAPESAVSWGAILAGAIAAAALSLILVILGIKNGQKQAPKRRRSERLALW